MAFKKDTVVGTMIFTIILCLSCSFMITGTAEVLKERKLAKKRDELKRYVLMAADVDISGDKDFRQIFEKSVTPLLVELDTGVVDTEANVLDFDDRMAAINPETSSKPKKDTAKIRSRADKARAFKVFDDNGQLHAVVLPIYGKGLWSMIYGYVAVKPDFNTIENVVFYEHGETPGIGDFLNDTEWTDKFKGKQLFDEKGKVSFKVVKGGAKAGDVHGVDAVSGATMTGRGVQRAVQFWFGSEGFETFLHKLKASEV
ncbi:Na(+)-translocating NADH-quinone reductase subunit C [Shewanella colwelliana]|uniref:Na(+)-translocating NADH-quinone reductase subunit C n=1 Tax=Shewanella colwelliana TaxID=23 RepID=A0A1E5IR38_SHECO|nr:Na(+)-translocating NADH-quinone reductase subunit C [Shewanella colwelliana]MCZ4336386.1 Na(+)-translocating NADH-quinone reductase subunit C [Shewanella colwelliana]MDX1283296.1 Na(+)-translocating NADH-quinone reductase subunit C [Shewanella colwelliana]OEG72937.1 Na(+)-translocating NADH-quinone reductase subunit C [Shewanella colwelliana]GIU19226.1 Na(+)-translocating NADH-quinone reductase subunit C [Shewanella colwelliana]GIU40610.1 Na(+)-translocating NADH-quinone reductase subunit 